MKEMENELPTLAGAKVQIIDAGQITLQRHIITALKGSPDTLYAYIYLVAYPGRTRVAKIAHDAGWTEERARLAVAELDDMLGILSFTDH